MNCTVPCVKDDWRGQLPVKTAQFTQFLSGMTSQSKIAQFKWECMGRLTKTKGVDTDGKRAKQRALFTLAVACTSGL